jgi:AraC family transcriptional regulator
MSQSQLGWDVQLSRAPRLVDIGTTRHGVERVCERYTLDTWGIHFYKYEATLLLGNERLGVTPGSVGIVPPSMPHEYRLGGRSEHLYARFVVSEGSEVPTRILALQDLGRVFSVTAQRFEQAMHAFRARPAQAEARLWDLLWELAERSARGQPRRSRRHDALDSACRVVQARLCEPLSLADLAAPAGVSPAHLTRLFRAELGVTASDYLRRCRLERALHLLTRTELPVKEVACEVGIPDLHAFNKVIRRGFGVSPRELRARGEPVLRQDLGHELVLSTLGADTKALYPELEVRAHDREVQIT